MTTERGPEPEPEPEQRPEPEPEQRPEPGPEQRPEQGPGPGPGPASGLETAYHPGIEAVVQHLPELAYQPHLYHQHHHQNLYADVPLPKPEPLPPSSVASPFSAVSRTFTSGYFTPSGKGRRVCGCSLLVFLLSAIIAILSAAVIGLAAATGIEANRASDAAAQVAVLSASLAAAPSTNSAISAIDAGCEANATAVTGTTYTAFKILGALRYTIYCNRDTKVAPLFSVFTPDFATCMDACAAYTRYIPERFGTGANTTCGAVSFIPTWTEKALALKSRAPGNCYLKPAMDASSLVVSTTRADCHSAVYVPGT
ncbi:hypothetical protein QBC39DRAFT_344497 [Podospora conica]|nr:hypothetical protein QBC39DRAFT_344497 [Schizothecium conicum]